MRPGDVGLCLSGGGYRAMLFHTGVLWRLNELGTLPTLSMISSVSSGAITAGVLAHAWPELEFSNGVAANFGEQVVGPVRELAGASIDVWAILRGLVKPWRSVGEELATSFRRHLFGGRRLCDLPARPRFVFTATNMQTGDLWRFSRTGTVGQRPADPALLLATAVAASSAFPPLLSPVIVRSKRGAVVLSDGGIFDNLALDPALDFCPNVLVSDGGLRMQVIRRVPQDWLRQLIRTLDVVDNQVRSLRKRALLESYTDGTLGGAYWGSYSDIANYGLPDTLAAPVERTLELAKVPTRLHTTPAVLQERLINWGYAICDAGMRRWVAPSAPPPTAYPYPAAGVG
ncbi:NTE family protein [Amycolatopsis marina]|uniref:NTE family protein n=1 Tax=Amycolatopsis marina TaxID=490629 RepID=A0A1I0W1T3_9PSEU|nr:patatin-like phospholipase family protein [Amycolatopsis marina]SFA82257.1 NTE family protein [Amycolatopsis marina]